jgi:hypothetical protein
MTLQNNDIFLGGGDVKHMVASSVHRRSNPSIRAALAWNL